MKTSPACSEVFEVPKEGWLDDEVEGEMTGTGARGELAGRGISFGCWRWGANCGGREGLGVDGKVGSVSKEGSIVAGSSFFGASGASVGLGSGAGVSWPIAASGGGLLALEVFAGARFVVLGARLDCSFASFWFLVTKLILTFCIPEVKLSMTDSGAGGSGGTIALVDLGGPSLAPSCPEGPSLRGDFFLTLDDFAGSGRGCRGCAGALVFLTTTGVIEWPRELIDDSGLTL